MYSFNFKYPINFKYVKAYLNSVKFITYHWFCKLIFNAFSDILKGIEHALFGGK